MGSPFADNPQTDTGKVSRASAPACESKENLVSRTCGHRPGKDVCPLYCYFVVDDRCCEDQLQPQVEQLEQPGQHGGLAGMDKHIAVVQTGIAELSQAAGDQRRYMHYIATWDIDGHDRRGRFDHGNIAVECVASQDRPLGSRASGTHAFARHTNIECIEVQFVESYLQTALGVGFLLEPRL